MWRRFLSARSRSAMKSQSRKNTELGGQSAQQLKIAAMPFDERKTFAATKEDLEQNTADVPVVMQRQVLVVQNAQRTVDVPLLQFIDTIVDVPVEPRCALCDIDQRRRLFADEAHVCFLEVPQSHSTGAGRAAHRGAQHRRSCARSVSQCESSNRSSMCLCHCRF